MLGISGADVFALAGYTVPSDLPTLRPYLSAKYRGLLVEDIDRIETYVAGSPRSAASRLSTPRHRRSERKQASKETKGGEP